MFDAIGQQMGQKGLAIFASRKQHIQNSINKKGTKKYAAERNCYNQEQHTVDEDSCELN